MHKVNDTLNKLMVYYIRTTLHYELILLVSVIVISADRFCGCSEILRYTGKLFTDLWPLLLTWFNFNPCMDK